MIRVYTAAGPADAHLVCNLLSDRGVKAVVQGENLWGARGELPLGSRAAPSVWVNEPDVEEARTLVAEYETRPKPQGPPWECPGCGEQIEGQFSECWQCRAKRPPA
jgi:hypothetical protein